MMSGDMRPQGRGKGLSEKNHPILIAFALVNEDFAVFQVNVWKSASKMGPPRLRKGAHLGLV